MPAGLEEEARSSFGRCVGMGPAKLIPLVWVHGTAPYSVCRRSISALDLVKGCMAAARHAISITSDDLVLQ